MESIAYEPSFGVMTAWGFWPASAGSLYGHVSFDTHLLSCLSFVSPLHGRGFVWTKNEGLAPSCGSMRAARAKVAYILRKGATHEQTRDLSCPDTLGLCD